MTKTKFVLTAHCPNRQGIVAAITAKIANLGCNILDLQQFDDVETNQFFARIVFEHETLEKDAAKAEMAPVLIPFGGSWSLRRHGTRRKVMLLASKFDHCLGDLLYRWRSGELNMDVVGVISNHPRETYNNMTLGNVQFHYLPVTRDTKAEQEAQILALIEQTGAELVVLARYMQVLSDDMAKALSGKCINIHHSFLPGFKGAKPYHQAHTRGVKLIGATSHYVTGDLDEGPIIEQDVERISHRDTPDDLIRKGRDIERRVLAGAVRAHLEDRVLLNGTKTIVFPA